MKKTSLILALVALSTTFTPMVKAEYKVYEVTKVYQPYYTAISEDRSEFEQTSYIPVNNTSTVQTSSCKSEIMPYTGTEGIWVLPFMTQDKSAADVQRILRTWGQVFKTPGYLQKSDMTTCDNSTSINTTKVNYLPTTTKSSTVNRIWGPRSSNGIQGAQGTGNITFRIK